MCGSLRTDPESVCVCHCAFGRQAIETATGGFETSWSHFVSSKAPSAETLTPDRINTEVFTDLEPVPV